MRRPRLRSTIWLAIAGATLFAAAACNLPRPNIPELRTADYAAADLAMSATVPEANDYGCHRAELIG